jgi:hypothetical protein
MRRALVIAGTQLLLWTVVAQVNHSLSDLHLYVFVGGLYIAFGALTQPPAPGLAGAIAAGLFCDATSPAGLLGTHTLLFAAAHLTVFHVRDRIPRDETASRVVVALLANLALFLVFSFSQVHHSPAPAEVWPRLLADLAVSQIVLTLLAPWFFALQARSLVLGRVDRESLA